MKTTPWTKMSELKEMTPEQINARYPASKVAEALVARLEREGKKCLKNQQVKPRRKLSEAERRRSVQVGRLAMEIAISRRAA